jgi:hypothetical protein
MALQPVDMQALFNQFDALGKEQNAVQQGLTVQEGLQDQKQQMKVAEENRRVRQTQADEQQQQEVKDATQGGGANKNKENHRPEAGDADEELSPDKDDEKGGQAWETYLGRHVDISY